MEQSEIETHENSINRYYFKLLIDKNVISEFIFFKYFLSYFSIAIKKVYFVIKPFFENI